MFGEEVFFGEPERDGEFLGALTDEHDVVGSAEDFEGYGRGRLDVLEAGDSAGFVCGAVHDGGVELDDAPLVGQAAVAHGHVVWVFLDDSDAFDDGLCGVSA